MHAFLFIGKDREAVETKVGQNFKTVVSGIIKNPIQKIEDVRELGKLIKLSQPVPIYIKIDDIDTATLEAQNAFLKSLEEPPKNINFILTAGSEMGILSTIISRCKVFFVSGSISGDLATAEKFVNGDPLERITVIEKIKAREEAESFIIEVISYYHKLIKNGESKKDIALNLKLAEQAIEALRRNGNVYLHLTNFAINIS